MCLRPVTYLRLSFSWFKSQLSCKYYEEAGPPALFHFHCYGQITNPNISTNLPTHSSWRETSYLEWHSSPPPACPRPLQMYPPAWPPSLACRGCCESWNRRALGLYSCKSTPFCPWQWNPLLQFVDSSSEADEEEGETTHMCMGSPFPICKRYWGSWPNRDMEWHHLMSWISWLPLALISVHPTPCKHLQQKLPAILQMMPGTTY